MSNYLLKLGAEALVVGLVFVAIAGVVMYVQRRCVSDPKPSTYYVSAFISAALAHLIFEAVGANRWYCRNGAACTKKRCR